MGITYTVDEQSGIVRSVVETSFSTDDILRVLSAILEDPAPVGRPHRVLSDHTQVREFITPEQVEVIVHFLADRAERTKGLRWAVVTHAKVSYGMMRMLGTHLETIPVELRIFGTEEDALQWLQSPPEKRDVGA